MASFTVVNLGYKDYLETWEKQKQLHAAVVAGEQPASLILVEHPPVITFGKKGGRQNLLLDEATLRAQGFSLYDIERGGDVTYHGPGQLVAYPIFRVGRQVRLFLRRLESVIISLLADYGLEAEGSPGYAGVWVAGEKLASIGVAIKRDVALHGLALNVSTNLKHFEVMIPCGLVGKRMTSLEKLLGTPVAIAEVKPQLIAAFREVFAESQATDHQFDMEIISSSKRGDS